MQCRWINHQLINSSEQFANNLAPENEIGTTQNQLQLVTTQSVHFQTHFEGHMEMYSDPQTVADYLNAHQGWFCRCAQPMQVEPISENGYILVIGRFGSFGHEVEPKIAVVLHPPKEGIYWMNSIPVPGYEPPGYEVDYQAYMELLEIPVNSADAGITQAYQKQGITQLPPQITKVRWELRLDVAVQFPKFIRKLPLSLIQCTGDRILTQIVRQVSPRLTYKVQQDFHARLNLPTPPKSSCRLQQVTKVEEEAA